jgi:hypothetical protein
VTHDQGVVYMCWGQNATQQAEQSMKSLWAHAPMVPVLVVGDAEACAYYATRRGVTAVHCEVDPFEPPDGVTRKDGFKFLAGRIKPLLAGISPWERTLYVDADSAFCASPQYGFDLLSKWDFVVAESPERSLADTIAGADEAHWSAAWLGTPHILYHNSGMLFWRKCQAVDDLMALWSEEWLRFGQWDEQVALLRALARSEVLYRTVPYTWNCKEQTEACLLYHWFGSWSARQFSGRRRGRMPGMPVGKFRDALAEPDDMVEIEIGLGRRVRCRRGEEDATLRRLEQQRVLKKARRGHGPIRATEHHRDAGKLAAITQGAAGEGAAE